MDSLRLLLDEFDFSVPRDRQIKLQRLLEDFDRSEQLSLQNIRNCHSYVVVDGDEAFLETRVLDIEESKLKAARGSIPVELHSTFNLVYVSGTGSLTKEFRSFVPVFSSVEAQYEWNSFHVLEYKMYSAEDKIKEIKEVVQRQASIELIKVEALLRVRGIDGMDGADSVSRGSVDSRLSNNEVESILDNATDPRDLIFDSQHSIVDQGTDRQVRVSYTYNNESGEGVSAPVVGKSMLFRFFEEN